MKELLTYVAQAGLLASCSWVVYKALFSRDALHHLRRFVLLAMLAASFALPVCRITVEPDVAIGLGIDHLPDMTTGFGIDHLAGQGAVVAPGSDPVATRAHKATPLPTRYAIKKNLIGSGWIIYLAGVATLLAFRMAGVARVRRIMRRASGRRVTSDGIEVLLLDDDVPPFSFGGRIVLSQADWRGEGADMIVRHESVHVRQRHGVDLTLMNVATAVLWFNPFVWLLRRELMLVHEIAADSGVVRSGFNPKIYQYLLISKTALYGGLMPVANHFRTSDLRKRITTMKRTSSQAGRNADGGVGYTKLGAALKLLLLLPLAAIALVAFAQTRRVADETPAEPEKEQLHLPFGNSFRVTGNYVERIVPATGHTRLMDGVLELNPGDGEARVHAGIDVVPTSDTIRAPYSGVVSSAVFEQSMGGKLVIAHPDGLETTYGHMAEFLVAEGAKVNGGQPIAIVGNTGVAAEKHLHLETRVDGKLTDPMKTLFGISTGASGSAVNGGGMIYLNSAGAL